MSRSPQKGNVLLLVLVGVLLLGAIGAGAYYFGKQSTGTKAPTPVPTGSAQQPTPTPDETANWKTYSNETLGITFRYPPEWGELEVTQEECDSFSGGTTQNSQSQPCLGVNLAIPSISEKYGGLFLASESKLFCEDPPGRGAYFGDIFCDYEDAEQFVVNRCVKRSPDKCGVLRNPNNILYVKSREEAAEQLGEGREAFYYFLYHPNHPFSGVALSTERLLDTPLESSSESVFDQILSTFKFTK